MTQILVDPPSVEAYGETAKGLFRAIFTELTNLVDNAFGAPFEGKNAAEFKSDVGRLAVSSAQQTHQSMQSMSRMVHSATLSIASSLGGSTVNIPIEAPDLAPPATSFDKLVSVDTERLKQFGDTVTAHFASVTTKLGQHLDALNGTRWEGEAKTTVSRTVGTATDNAQGVCDTVLKQLNQRITEQAAATETADRASY